MIQLLTPLAPRRALFLLLCLTWLTFMMLASGVAAQDEGDEEEDEDLPPLEEEILQSKPSWSDLRERLRNSKYWILRDLNLFGIQIPLSPITLFSLSLVGFHIYLNWGTYAWCEASHILIRGHNPETKQQMQKWKQEIGGNLEKFSEFAKQHSACPSGNKGGSLGRFYRGDMAGNFDKTCFDPKVPTATTVGPIETSFGCHLIFIQNRSI